jgi:hypothetical protein
MARANNPSHTARTGTENPPLVSKWSGITAATFFNTLPPLRITEIQYHPEDPAEGSTWSDGDFEFVELANLSGSPLELAGFSLAGGIQYTFTAASGVTRSPPARGSWWSRTARLSSNGIPARPASAVNSPGR